MVKGIIKSRSKYEVNIVILFFTLYTNECNADVIKQAVSLAPSLYKW